MRKLFLTAAGIFGTLPGLVILTSGLSVPPNSKPLFFGVIQALGTLTIVLLIIMRSRINRTSPSRIAIYAVVSIVISLIALCAYIVEFDKAVVTHRLRGTAYFPLVLTGEIKEMVKTSGSRRAKEMVKTSGSRRAAIERYGIDAIKDAIDKTPDYSIPLTTIVLLLTYQAVFTGLTAAFGLAGLSHETSSSGFSP